MEKQGEWCSRQREWHMQWSWGREEKVGRLFSLLKVLWPPDSEFEGNGVVVFP